MLKKEQGFTIIEVLVAVLIIGVATIGIVMGFSNCLAMVENIKQTSVANRVAQEIMEELRGGKKIEEIPASIERKGVVYTISISPFTVSPALTQVSVKVSWQSHTGKTLSRSLVTYFTENGITRSQ